MFSSDSCLIHRTRRLGIIMYYNIIALLHNIPSGWSDIIIIRAGSDIQICFHDVAKHGTPRVLHIII